MSKESEVEQWIANHAKPHATRDYRPTDHARDIMRKLVRNNTALQKEVQQHKKDAERFQELMARAQIIKVTSGQLLCLPQIRLYEIDGCDFRGNPNAAIDAAIQPKDKK